MRISSDWFFDNTGKVLVGLGIFCFLWMLLMAKQEAKSYKAFMEECMKDHKEYECKVLYRQTLPKETYTVIPR